MYRYAVFAVLIWLAPSVCAASDVMLVENGRSKCVVLVAADADENEKLAASELTTYLRKITGASIRQVSNSGALGMLPIRIGKAAGNEPLLAKVADAPDGFAISIRADGINIVGTTSEGTLCGAYDLLDRLGVRWFMPGEIGEVVPQLATIALTPAQITDKPDFAGRQLDARSEWGKRNKLGGPYFPSAHSWDSWVPPTQYFKDHPEYFALVNAKRQPGQLCTSNPEVIKLVADRIKETLRNEANNPLLGGSQWVGIGPNDGLGFCECANCRALDTGDWDPYSGEISISDRFLTFANAVAAQVHEEFPKAKFAYYIYATYMRPPLRVKPDPSVTGALAPIGLCRVHGLDNPNCPEREYWKQLLQQWPKVMKEVYHRGYAYNLAGPQVPLSLVSVWRTEVPECKRDGIVGFRVECQYSWPSHGPTPYIMARLLWHADADVDALLDDYFTKFFGPARQPMSEYWKTLDTALYNADYHTGAGFDIAHWYPPAVMRKLARQIAAAKAAATTEPYKERVRIFARAFEYLQAYQAMMAADQRLDFAGALRGYDAGQKIIDEFMAYQPPLFNQYIAPTFWPRFYHAFPTQGFERTTGGNEKVVGFADEWSFFLDPDGVGEEQALYAPALRGGNWKPIKTFSASWSDQGLRYYKGDAWYRQTVIIPERFRGRKLWIWFGAVDESAKVWVNGKLVGEHRDNALDPFEFEITAAVQYGGPNVVAMKATNKTVDELGTGGITYPVMIYAPKPDSGT